MNRKELDNMILVFNQIYERFLSRDLMNIDRIYEHLEDEKPYNDSIENILDSIITNEIDYHSFDIHTELRKLYYNISKYILNQLEK